MTCPICKKPVAPAYRPFCSKRCADIDLGRWLTGGYAIPGEPAEPDHPDWTPPGASPKDP
ncbi:MAG: DNA gyrase inhibitor YacG [Pseudomonadota bacterium]